jgi:hypothetical protein
VAPFVGVKYDLKLSARNPSFASEACIAFETSAGYAAVTCPLPLDASGDFEVTAGRFLRQALHRDRIYTLIP